jgi:putative transcriptional regulator
LIVYRDVLERLKEAGFTTYRILQEKLIPQSSLTRIRRNEPINLSTIDTICKLLNCQPGDLLEYVPDDEQMK